jgi:hypothetical protein
MTKRIAMDGKVLRGSYEAVSDDATVHRAKTPLEPVPRHSSKFGPSLAIFPSICIATLGLKIWLKPNDWLALVLTHSTQSPKIRLPDPSWSHD